MATGKKITQFKTIKDSDLANDATLWVAGDSVGTLYKPTGKQVKKLISDISTTVVNTLAPGIFNSMWATIKASEQIITARWTFNIINLPVVTNSTSKKGDIWHNKDANEATDKLSIHKDTTNVREDIVTSASNPFLEGAGERMLSANDGGGLMANFGILEEIVTDIDIVDKCMQATYIAGNIFTSTITPTNNKIFYKGQICRSTDPAEPYLYKAISNNTVIRILLG